MQFVSKRWPGFLLLCKTELCCSLVTGIGECNMQGYPLMAGSRNIFVFIHVCTPGLHIGCCGKEDSALKEQQRRKKL